MALKPCKECGQEISSKADKCPNCGAGTGKAGGCLKFLVFGGLLILVLTIISVMNGPSDLNKVNDDRIVAAAHEFVLNKLSTPSTADFPSSKHHTIQKTENTYDVSGYVDAQNNFGATVRNYWNVQMRFDPNNNLFYLISINIL
jgi:hypothetical protein